MPRKPEPACEVWQDRGERRTENQRQQILNGRGEIAVVAKPGAQAPDVGRLVRVESEAHELHERQQDEGGQRKSEQNGDAQTW